MANSKEHQYTPILSDDEATDDTVQASEKGFHNKQLVTAGSPVVSQGSRLALSIVIAIETFAILILIGTLWMKTSHSVAAVCTSNQYPHELYSPAQEAIENVYKVFTMGFGKVKTIYQGEPSPEVDQAWLDLYNAFGLSKIPKEQARLLPNKTLAIPGDEDNYAVGLSVFHQLHCLNLIRKGLRADYYADPVTGAISGILPEDWPEHVSHCLDALRQSVMCASDISLIVWQWSEEANKAGISMSTIHSCRNFDKIADWAKAHKRTTAFNTSVHVEDDIEIPLIV